MYFLKKLNFVLLLSSLITLAAYNYNINAEVNSIFENRRDGFIVSSDPVVMLKQLEQYVPNPFVIAEKVLSGQSYKPSNNSQKKALWLVELRIEQFRAAHPKFSNHQMLEILPDLISLHETAKQILVNSKFKPNSELEKNLVKVLEVIRAELRSAKSQEVDKNYFHQTWLGFFTGKYGNELSDNVKKALNRQKFESPEFENLILDEAVLDLFDYEIFLWLCGKSTLLNKYNVFNLSILMAVSAQADQHKQNLNHTPKTILVPVIADQNKQNLKPVLPAPAKAVPAPIQDQNKRNDQERIADYRQAEQMFNFINF